MIVYSRSDSKECRTDSLSVIAQRPVDDPLVAIVKEHVVHINLALSPSNELAFVVVGLRPRRLSKCTAV